MNDTPDAELLEEFKARRSEEAFAQLVKRHASLVYSVALRLTGNPQHAEEVTQAVFIIFARKAPTLGRQTILSGWLYHTARLTSANFRRAEWRRLRREQEALMQSTSDTDDIESAWQELSPLLDDAMARLGRIDRDAIVLRFFENRSLREVGRALGLEERAAQKRVSRAMEKLRAFFVNRGTALPAAMIGAAVSAHSVQAAPVAVAAGASAAALNGTAVTASTLSLVEGALKIMAWAKAKFAMTATAGVLLTAGTATFVVERTLADSGAVLKQQLSDGSVLRLSRLEYGSVEFTPRFDVRQVGQPEPEFLAAQFKLETSNPDHPLVKPAFYRQYRCVVWGSEGIEFIEEFWNRGFAQYADGTFGYIMTRVFPRDSEWLWFRIERSETNNPYGPWQSVAEFKARNPTSSKHRTWVASATPVTNRIGSMEFVLDKVTVKAGERQTRDIWEHVVDVGVSVWEDGLALTNWGAAFTRLEDASGNNSPILQNHRSLDPRHVWRMEMDFQPQSAFASENLAIIRLPATRYSSFETNLTLMGIPVRVAVENNSGDESIIASIPTNYTDHAIAFVSAEDGEGRFAVSSSGNWNQFRFRRGSFAFRLPDGSVTMVSQPETLTIAVVPNIRTVFYAQPELLFR